MIKASRTAVAVAMLLAPAAFATKVPVPIEGANVNVTVQLQFQGLINEGGAPDGRSPSYDIYTRRTRAQLSGDMSPNWSFLIRVDNANFGKFGNFNSRMILQDAAVYWSPTGQKGGTALIVDAGLMQIPISHYQLGSSTNYVAADLQTDSWRLPGSALPAFRDVGVQFRGWTLERKLGFRFGAFTGYTPTTAANCNGNVGGTCVTPNRNPAFRGLLNFALLGTEEGGYYYTSYRWGKVPILSLNVAVNYQSRAIRNAFGSLTDSKIVAGGIFANIPSGDSELVAEVTTYLNGNGTGSANTGVGISGNLGYRIGPIAPYVAYDYFQSTDCDASLPAAQLTTCRNTVDTADSRNLKVGLNVFFNKSANHLHVEFGVNHGTSGWGPSGITVATAGYVPLSLDPVSGSSTRRAWNAKLANPAFRSLLAQWTFLF